LVWRRFYLFDYCFLKWLAVVLFKNGMMNIAPVILTEKKNTLFFCATDTISLKTVKFSCAAVWVGIRVIFEGKHVLLYTKETMTRDGIMMGR
jgi:hypothetical protein